VSLPGFEDLHVVLPRGDGATKARLAVIAHGAGERPEPHCEHYARLLGDGFLLVCTRGHPNNRHLPEPERGYFYDGHPRLGRELAATFALLERDAPFAGHVELEGALYAGFSQGATMGVLALHEEPELAARFDALLLIDGGTGDWTVALAERMAARAVRVALVCGVATCREKARRTEPWLAKAKLDAKVRLTSAGHVLGGAVEEEVRALLPWLLARSAPSSVATSDPCTPLPKVGEPCKAGSGACVESWGTPGGRSSALWCRDGRWRREEEDNLP
jgi:pimeloyl-ACP methyl ester carboxylesterase